MGLMRVGTTARESNKLESHVGMDPGSLNDHSTSLGDQVPVTSSKLIFMEHNRPRHIFLLIEPIHERQKTGAGTEDVGRLGMGEDGRNIHPPPVPLTSTEDILKRGSNDDVSLKREKKL